jgi:hypothetical protein
MDYTRDVKSLGGGAMPGGADARNSSRTILKLGLLLDVAVAAYALWTGFYLCALVLLGAALLALFLLRRSASREDDGQAIAAEWGVPHCKFERRADGFTVTFNRSPEWLEKISAMTGNKESGALFALVLLPVVLIAMIAYAIFGNSKIEVGPEFIIIDGKKLVRKDFSGFSVHHTLKIHGKEDTLGILGFRYGARSFSLGGTWPEGLAQEVASALNRHLRLVPLPGDESRVSPAQLRAARSMEF